jgi:hypothetical protein
MLCTVSVFADCSIDICISVLYCVCFFCLCVLFWQVSCLTVCTTELVDLQNDMICMYVCMCVCSSILQVGSKSLIQLDLKMCELLISVQSMHMSHIEKCALLRRTEKWWQHDMCPICGDVLCTHLLIVWVLMKFTEPLVS